MFLFFPFSAGDSGLKFFESAQDSMGFRSQVVNPGKRTWALRQVTRKLLVNFFGEIHGNLKGMMVINNPLIRPYFLGVGGHWGGTLRFP